MGAASSLILHDDQFEHIPQYHTLLRHEILRKATKNSSRSTSDNDVNNNNPSCSSHARQGIWSKQNVASKGPPGLYELAPTSAKNSPKKMSPKSYQPSEAQSGRNELDYGERNVQGDQDVVALLTTVPEISEFDLDVLADNICFDKLMDFKDCVATKVLRNAVLIKNVNNDLSKPAAPNHAKSISCHIFHDNKSNFSDVCSNNALRLKNRTSWNITRDKATTILSCRLISTKGTEMVEIDYHFNRQTGKEKYKSKGSLVNLLYAITNDEKFLNVPGIETEKVQRSMFFQNLVLIINKAYGYIEWNEVTIVVEEDIENRLEVVEYDMEPTKIFINVLGLREVQVFRRLDQLRIVGIEPEGAMKSIIMKGIASHGVSIGEVRDGRLDLIFPDFET